MSSEPPAEGVGAVIREARERHGLSRKELVQRSGLSYPYISQIESGDRQPSTKSLVRIAEALGLRASDLLAASELIDQTATDSLRAMEPSPPAASPMQRWVPAPVAVPPPRQAPIRRQKEAPRHGLAELMSVAAGLHPDDLAIVLELARRLAR